MHYFDPIFNLGLTIYFIKQIYALYKTGLIILIFSRLSFEHWDNQTNKLCLHYTAHSTYYTVYHKDQSLVVENQCER